MKRLKNELNALVNRGVDRHLRLAVTGLSRSGKTAFITAMVNQLLNIHAGARLPLLSAVREERLLGVKRIPSVTLAFRASHMMKDWRSYMAILPPGRRQRAASVKSAWRYVLNRTIRCYATSRTPPRCIWRLWIIPANGCSTCRCWRRTI